MADPFEEAAQPHRASLWTMGRLVRRALSIAAALTLAVVAVQSALAQAAEPRRQPVECRDGDSDCAPPSDEPGTASGGSAVVLPDLIVDLFPNPTGSQTGEADGGAGGLPVPTPDPRRPTDAALPPAVGAPAQAQASLPAGPQADVPAGPIIAPTDLPLAEPLRAIA